MTANQINYAKHREDVRHNLASESLSAESNRIGWRNAEIAQQNADTNLLNAQTRQAELGETIRSNKASESLRAAQNAETARSNRANEILQSERNQETQRANVTSEEIARSQQRETVTHNRTTEQLTSSSTRASVLNNLVGAAASLLKVVAG